MNKVYSEKIQEDNSWFWESDKRYYLILTDDLDSLFSALLILQYRPNWKIGGFFDYKEGKYINIFNEDKLTQDNTIWVDCSCIKQGDKCISNHLTSISGEVHNSCDINLNTIDGNNRDKHYFSKYNLSTFLLVTSLLKHEGYEINNHVGRVLSLTFDASYKAYYQPFDYADKGVQRRYLCDVLELQDIYNVQADMTRGQFVQIIQEQNIYSKLHVGDKGIEVYNNVDLEMLCKYLNIDIDLEKLNGMFGLVEKSTIDNRSVNVFRGRDLQDTKITSFAITSNNNVSFSYKVD